MTTVINEGAVFAIRYVIDGDTLGSYIYRFPAGTTNDQACRAYDHFVATGELPS